MTPGVATVEVPFEAIVKELGSKVSNRFISEIRKCYNDSIVELRKANKTLTIDQIETENKKLKKKTKRQNAYWTPLNSQLMSGPLRFSGTRSQSA
jgi:hypothetical protein